jgi:mannose-6-phosphate isomerase-like protein (cupin superfamily)
MMDHQYERGWQRYGFDNQQFEAKAGHGSKTTISSVLAFNRGLGKPHVTFSLIPPNTTGLGLGLHVHRNLTTGKDAEVWFLIVEGHGEMTFTNGDVVNCGPGDLITSYPGTGHSFRAIEGSVKVIAIAPEMYTFPDDSETTNFPEDFSPRIRILEFDDGSMCVRHAVCSVCGSEWHRPDYDQEAATLPIWARNHQHLCETEDEV